VRPICEINKMRLFDAYRLACDRRESPEPLRFFADCGWLGHAARIVPTSPHLGGRRVSVFFRFQPWPASLLRFGAGYVAVRGHTLHLVVERLTR